MSWSDLEMIITTVVLSDGHGCGGANASNDRDGDMGAGAGQM